MSQYLPEQRHQAQPAEEVRSGSVLPAQRIPPGMIVGYDAHGRPVYVPEQQREPVVVQMPNQSMPPWLRDLIVVVLLVLAVVAVSTAAICAVVVLAGGTLIGIIGTVGANAVPIGVTTIGTIVAVGWAMAQAKAKFGGGKGR